MAQRSRGNARHNARNIVRGAGIRKRSPQPPRIERDGDLVMDGANETRGRPRGGNRGSHPYNRGGPSRNVTDTNALSRAVSSPRNNSNLILRDAPRNSGIRTRRSPPGKRDNKKSERNALDELAVQGWKQSAAAQSNDHGISQLVAFINKKVTKNDSDIIVQQSQQHGDDLHVWVKPEDTEKVLKINNYSFARATLSIRLIKEAKDANSTLDLRSKLEAIINRRYSAEDKLLNLANLAQDEMTTPEMFESEERISKIFAALMKICEEKWRNIPNRRNAVHSLSLADNGLPNVSIITIVAQTFSNIKNLDLSGNNLANLKALEPWSRKYRYLEHIILRGNPLENVPDFHIEVMKWYPKLRIIDAIQVRSAEEIAQNEHRGLIILPGSFQDESGIGENFLKQFFASFDSDRPALVNAIYCEKSVFSLSVVTRARGKGTETKIAPFAPWIGKSRNLAKVTSPRGRQARIFHGREQIRTALVDLPATRHPDIMNESQKWMLECRLTEGLPDYMNNNPAGVNGLLVTVHGEFEEDQGAGNNNFTTKRSFDRSFTLGPGEAPGIIYIYNDCFVVRPYSGYEAFRPTVTPQQSPQLQVPQIVVPSIVEIPSGLPAPDGFGLPTPDKTPERVQEELIALELSKLTRMTLEYSVMCLRETQFNLEAAGKKFEETKPILPATAFW